MTIKIILFVGLIVMSVSKCSNDITEYKDTGTTDSIETTQDDKKRKTKDKEEEKEKTKEMEETKEIGLYDTITNIPNVDDIKIDYKQFESQLVELSEQIAANPEDAILYERRAELNFMLGNTDEACADWKKSLELGNEYAQFAVDENCSN